MNQLSDMAVLENVEAKQALHALNSRFCRALDRMDRDLMNSLWTDDAEVDIGAHQGDARSFSEAVTADDGRLERSFSSISNEYFDIDGDQAKGELYVINISTVVLGGEKEDRLIGGRYLDRYQKVNGDWKIASRIFVHDWNMSHPTTAVWDEGLFGMIKLRGTRDKTDPVYSLLGG